MNFFRTFGSNTRNFGVNGLQIGLKQVLTNNGSNGLPSSLPPIGFNYLQRREMAARRGKRIAATREKQRLSRIKKEEARNAGPKVWKPNKLKIDKSALNVGPRRFSDQHLKSLDAVMDNVFITSLYKQITYSLIESIDNQRETHDKSVYNDPKAVVESTIELDLRTKKKNKFCDNFMGIISFPNKFEFKVNRRVVAICKKDEDKYEAKEAGADVVGGQEIIKMLSKGDLNMSNFDDLVCHGDMLVDLAQIRGILGPFFPSKLKGNLGFDIKKLVTQFVQGIEYKCLKDDLELDFGWVRVPFGRLDMNNKELEHNFRLLLSTIEKHKPSTALADTPFITRVLIQSEPSNEEFAVKFWNYIDGYVDPYSSTDDRNEDEVKESIEKSKQSSIQMSKQ